MRKRILSLILALIMIFSVFSGATMQSYGAVEDIMWKYLEKKGVLGYLYNPDGKYFYTTQEPWQSNFGFNNVYDIASPFAVMFYDTEYFDFRYDNKDWRIQFWKGQYGWVFIGAEIGIYNKPINSPVQHYNCPGPEDYLGTQLTLTRFGIKQVFSTPYEMRWWCTGFVPGSLVIFSWRGQLRMDARITMKDMDMFNAFTKSLRDKGIGYKSDGLDVFVKY